jgi:TRAP-type mannitol/chloroaromatic compound transport system substrate-binding protein
MPVGDFTVRQQEWDKLPEDIKQILIGLCREWAWDTIEKVAAEDAKLASEAKGKGYTAIAWTPEEKAKARKIAIEIWQGWKSKNEQTKRAIEMQEAWLRELGRIQ